MESLKRKRKTSIQPRWYNQAYLLFLALRQHPQNSLPRIKLIEAAIELDKKIGVELQLPRVFRGKTPKNSASATLTNNSDRYFIAFKPEGSKSTHFKLAYKPGNVDDAVKEYQNWFKKLIEHDWPFCFGVPKTTTTTTTTTTSTQETHYHTPVSHHDELESIDKELVELALVDQKPVESLSVQVLIEPVKTTTTTEEEEEPSKETPSTNNPVVVEATAAAVAVPEPLITLDQLDLTNIPESWHDIVEVKPSLIPFGGNGLFAKRKLPYNTPIGFYFGVPMTEDEFDSLKDRVGRSSEYSIMYRRTVLDATDDSGQPITDPNNPRYCPFHFMNETSSQKTASIAFVEGAIVNQIICWTKKEIEKGEELLVWYGKDVHRYWTQEEEEEQEKKQKEKKKDLSKKKSKLNNLLDVKHDQELDQPQQEKDPFVIVDESSAYFSPQDLLSQSISPPLKKITLVNYTKKEIERW